MARKIDGRLKPLDPGGKYHNNNLPGDVSLKTIENNRIFFFFFFTCCDLSVTVLEIRYFLRKVSMS